MMPRASPKKDRILKLAEEALLRGENPSPAKIAGEMLNVSRRIVEQTIHKLRKAGKLPRRLKADFLKKADAQ
jgi:biotin operon repressor